MLKESKIQLFILFSDQKLNLAPVCVHVGSEQIVTNKCDRKIFAVTEKKNLGGSNHHSKVSRIR